MNALASRHDVPDDLNVTALRAVYRQLWRDVYFRDGQLRRKDCRRPTVVRLAEQDSEELAFPIYGIRCGDDLLTWAPVHCGDGARSCEVRWPFDYFAPRCAGAYYEEAVLSDPVPTSSDVLGGVVVTGLVFRAWWGTNDGDLIAADTCGLLVDGGRVVVHRFFAEDASQQSGKADADDAVIAELLEAFTERGLTTHPGHAGDTSSDGAWARFELFVTADEIHAFEAAAMLDATDLEPALLGALARLDKTCTEIHRIVGRTARAQQTDAPGDAVK